MKLIVEYLHDAVRFERMAAETENSELRAAFIEQAVQYRALAAKRSAQLKLPNPEIPSDKS